MKANNGSTILMNGEIKITLRRVYNKKIGCIFNKIYLFRCYVWM